MTAFEDLLSYSPEKKEELGIVHTPGEIRQQPRSWAKTVELLERRQQELEGFLKAAGLGTGGNTTVISAGAGTSEFVGSASQGILQAGLQETVISVPTTDLVTHARDVFLDGHEPIPFKRQFLLQLFYMTARNVN